MLKRLLLSLLMVCAVMTTHAQFGVGMTISNDLYNRYVNPEDGLNNSRSNGSALLNLGIGPKIWIGGENVSFSAETQVNWGIFGLSTGDFKGLGNVAFPILGQFNFRGVSGLNKEGRLGLSIGGGIQYNKTEIYGIRNSFQENGVTRDYFKTYIIQLGYGFGVSGFAGKLFGRYGFNPDVEGSSSFNIGLQFDFNFMKMKDIDSPASQL